jgi:GNAT superfamily N-acetyltransferase
VSGQSVRLDITWPRVSTMMSWSAALYRACRCIVDRCGSRSLPVVVRSGRNVQLLRSPQRCRVLVSVTEEAASARAGVHLLADRADLIEAVTDLRWLEWGHPPEPIDRDWWRAATVREAGSSGLPMTWVASDQSGALGAVGLGRFDIEERRDRSPWLLGMIVRPDRRGSGIGRLLLTHLEDWAYRHGYQELWVATGGAAVGFYERCGWRICETVARDFEPATVLTKEATSRADVLHHQPGSGRPTESANRPSGCAHEPNRVTVRLIAGGVGSGDIDAGDVKAQEAAEGCAEYERPQEYSQYR